MADSHNDSAHGAHSDHAHTAPSHTTTTRTTTTTSKSSSALANVLALLGFLILFIIVIWGVINLASLSLPWFSNLFQGSKVEKIAVSAPATVASGSPLPVSWKYTPSTKGSYAVIYTCTKDLKIAVPRVGGITAIPCGTSYRLGNATSSALMIPLYGGSTSAKAQISIVFIPSAASSSAPTASGTATVTVTPSSKTTKTTKTTTINTNLPQPVITNDTTEPEVPAVVKTTPKPATSPVSTTRPATPADLAVSIVAVGVIDPATGAFMQRAPYSSSEISAVQFDIRNDGGRDSGAYTFEARIPTSQPYTFYSEVQQSLEPGAHVINTLRFSPALDGNFSVTVDTANTVSESNESNNNTSAWVSGSQSDNLYYYQSPQQYAPVQYAPVQYTPAQYSAPDYNYNSYQYDPLQYDYQYFY